MAGAVLKAMLKTVRQNEHKKTYYPSRGVLLWPSRRALYRAGYIWREALERQQNIQSIGMELGP